MRARPEPTQLECLPDASFLGKLMVLPANVRLDRKGIARYKQSSLFGLIISNERKKFYNIDTWSTRPPKLLLIAMGRSGKGLQDILVSMSTTSMEVLPLPPAGVSPTAIISFVNPAANVLEIPR